MTSVRLKRMVAMLALISGMGAGMAASAYGEDAEARAIIDKAIEVGADAIGLSALLVSTSKQMPLCVPELDKRNLKFPVLIRFALDVGRSVADADALPTWVAGDEFLPARQKSGVK